MGIKPVMYKAVPNSSVILRLDRELSPAANVNKSVRTPPSRLPITFAAIIEVRVHQNNE
jgi:hypothetical protein